MRFSWHPRQRNRAKLMLKFCRFSGDRDSSDRDQNVRHGGDRPHGPRARWLVIVAALLVGVAIDQPALAQTSPAPGSRSGLPTCQPPRSGEFLVLVRRPDRQIEAQLYAALPAGVSADPCDYLGEPVMRLGGFPTAAIAQAWADFVRDRTGTPAFVIEPSTASAAGSQLKPGILGSGYAVLVDYFGDPATVDRLKSIVTGPIGLVAHGQRPYLLIWQGADLKAAGEALQRASDQGFSAFVVDRRQVVQLRPSIVSIGSDPKQRAATP